MNMKQISLRSGTPTDLKIKTGSSICHSEMKSIGAAILGGPFQYIEITLRSAFFFDDFWNVRNNQHRSE